MIDASPELIALLNSDQFLMADLYTITTKAGQVLKYTSADVDVYQEGSTNFLKFSSNLSSGYGTVGISAYQATSDTPLSSATAKKMVEDSSTGLHRFSYVGTLYNDMNMGALATFSIYLKAAGRTKCVLFIFDDAATSYVYTTVDLTAGTVTPTGAGGTGGSATAKIASVGNGWFRITLSGIAGAGSGVQAQVQLRLTDAAGAQTYAGNGTSGMYIAAPQLEQKPYATAYIPTTSAAVTRAAFGPFSSSMLIKRGSTRQVRGIEVDDLSVTFFPDDSNLIGSTPFLKAVGKGALDGADFKLERAFFYPDWSTLVGTIIRFVGRIEDIEEYTRTEIPVTVKSDLVLLNTQMPRNIYQPGCRRTLFDSGCGLSKAAFAVNSSAASGSTAALINCGLSQAAGWFDLGTVTFTSGQNSGVSRTVKSYNPGVLAFSLPWPYAPAVGDTFTAYAGCDKQQSTCQTKFSNLTYFSGEPYVPAAETAY